MAPMHDLNHVSNTPVQSSAIPTATSVAPTPMHNPNHVSNTPVQGSAVPTAASVAPKVLITTTTTHTSIRKDSGKSTTDVGEGGFLLFLSFTLFIFNLVLSIGNVGPLLDDGNKIYFNLTSYFNFGVDVEMEDPIAPQGASHMTGGILRGNAYGNSLNHADFEHEDDSGAYMFIKPTLTFKVFVYVEYGDVLEINKVPDFDPQFPITVFLLNDMSLLAKLLLKKSMQYHDSIPCKYCLLFTY